MKMYDPMYNVKFCKLGMCHMWRSIYDDINRYKALIANEEMRCIFPVKYPALPDGRHVYPYYVYENDAKYEHKKELKSMHRHLAMLERTYDAMNAGYRERANAAQKGIDAYMKEVV